MHFVVLLKSTKYKNYKYKDTLTESYMVPLTMTMERVNGILQ